MPQVRTPAEARRDAATRRSSQPGRRQELLDQLEDIFLEHGFSSLTIDDLCRRLRCSKTTLYSVADSREQIIQAATRHFFAKTTAMVEFEVSGESDPGRRIIRYLNGVGTAMQRNSVEFYVDMVSYEPTEAIYRLNSEAAARRVKGFIEEGVDSGHFRAADAALAGQAVALLIEGMQSGELLQQTGLSAGEAYYELGELLVNGLSVRK